MTETIDNVNEETIELSIDDLEAILGQGGTQENINIAEMLETEMVTSRTLYLNGEVEADTVDWLIQMIHYWNRLDVDLDDENKQEIILHIDTPGGDAYSCAKLCSAILNSTTPVIGVVEGGMCMSAGIYILASCHYKIVSKLANVMYHQLSASSEPKSLREMKISSEHYNNMQSNLDEMLIENTGLTKSVLQSVKDRNIDWFIHYKDMEKYKIADRFIQ